MRLLGRTRGHGRRGSFARWLLHEPRLAWTDRTLLSDEGVELIGHSLADALLAAYDAAGAAP